VDFGLYRWPRRRAGLVDRVSAHRVARLRGTRILMHRFIIRRDNPAGSQQLREIVDRANAALMWHRLDPAGHDLASGARHRSSLTIS
jgi:hypothetical protein